MKKILQVFSILLLVLGFVAVSTLAETTTPTEVERSKDYYYFKIHGKPSTKPHEPPADGEAEFIYKNLSTKTQSINVIVEVTWAGRHEFWPHEAEVGPGEECSAARPEDFDVTVDFELWIDSDLAFNGTIWVPPPQ